MTLLFLCVFSSEIRHVVCMLLIGIRLLFRFPLSGARHNIAKLALRVGSAPQPGFAMSSEVGRRAERLQICSASVLNSALPVDPSRNVNSASVYCACDACGLSIMCDVSCMWVGREDGRANGLL